eukprot:NODE_1598_length_1119_cov_10.493458_g1303_i0.p1 GENE.NODE_1598_length_1119_cov_10.493458_g1303_i0~~NODE_1598_length_1119_cov_10.493458_g1303_i0.p1  ORF type:complete len:300 (+),score=71.74 NODE_1598_length_1119_cov_10.493458_g1303_i0:31-930(+)
MGGPTGNTVKVNGMVPPMEVRFTPAEVQDQSRIATCGYYEKMVRGFMTIGMTDIIVTTNLTRRVVGCKTDHTTDYAIFDIRTPDPPLAVQPVITPPSSPRTVPSSPSTPTTTSSSSSSSDDGTFFTTPWIIAIAAAGLAFLCLIIIITVICVVRNRNDDDVFNSDLDMEVPEYDIPHKPETMFPGQQERHDKDVLSSNAMVMGADNMYFPGPQAAQSFQQSVPRSHDGVLSSSAMYMGSNSRPSSPRGYAQGVPLQVQHPLANIGRSSPALTHGGRSSPMPPMFPPSYQQGYGQGYRFQ